MRSDNKTFWLKLICLNAVQYAIYILYSLVTIPAAFFCGMVMGLFYTRRNTLKRVRLLTSFWARGLCFLTLPFVRVRFKSNNNKDKTGPCIYVCNHRSFLDGFLVAYPCWRCEVVQAVNVWPFRIPVIGVIARVSGYLDVNTVSFEDLSNMAKKLISEGVSIISFPEGTRSKDRVTGPFHSSMFRIALETCCPIVPICISGNETVLRRGNIMLRPGVIKIHKLPALQWEEYKGMTPFQLKIKVRETMIRELSVMETDT